YLELDEPVIYYYFQRWQHEKDAILSDLCSRFINRRLFKYVEFDPIRHSEQYEKLRSLFEKAGIDQNDYLAIDSSADLTYDVYRAGEGRVPIYLQMPSGEEKELSTHSVIVDSITGKTREDHKMYYPQEKIASIRDENLKNEIDKLLYYS